MDTPEAPPVQGPDAERPVIVDYTDDWPARAASLIATLRNQLGARAARIEHIGSTAIPGMAAKDVLDLQISVTSLEDTALEFDQPLGSLGFRRTPYEQDHVPAGRPDDGREWVKRLWARRDHPGGDVNLHVRLVGSPNERLALLFRDWFRTHPEATPAYATFKRSLAAAVPDIAAYTDIKDPVVDLVITVADTWAADTGWQP
jgi:dephospho-CoA kinase